RLISQSAKSVDPKDPAGKGRTTASGAQSWERRSGLACNLHCELRVIHTCGHIGYVVNGTITPMKDPSVTAIGFLDLPGGYPRLLVAIAAIRANDSHFFVVDRRNTNVELIDSVDNELDIGPSQLCSLHA